MTRNRKTNERTVAFVVARLSSSRFAAKHLRPIGHQPLLKWVTAKLVQCRQVDDIVLATVNETDNLPLKVFAAKHGISCFWYEGEVDHVTTRLRLAAEKYDADICSPLSGIVQLSVFIAIF